LVGSTGVDASEVFWFNDQEKSIDEEEECTGVRDLLICASIPEAG
jgi:hypothetical protein